jgi:hypothetical protein
VPPAIPGVGAAPKFMMALLENDLLVGQLYFFIIDLTRSYLCWDGDADAALANADNPGKEKLYLFCG